MVEELIKFAKQSHPGFSEVPESFLRRLFETYRDTTLIHQVDGQIRGFAIYQEWPDCLNFFAMAGIGSKIENLSFFINDAPDYVREKLPNKKIVFFDEESMELKTICRQ